MNPIPFPFLAALAVSICGILAAENDPVNSDLARLQGEWRMVSGSADGQPMPEQMVKQMKRIGKGDETTTTIAGQLFFKAKIAIDPSKNPKTIDYQMTDGVTKGQKQLGIYELEGDSLKSCFGKPGAARPIDFTSRPGDGRTLSVWKREKGTDDSVFALSPGDVTEAVIDASGPTRLQVMLVPDKSAELSAFTARNLNKQVKIVVGGKVRSEPFVRERIAGGSIEVFVTSPEDAVAAVKELLTSKLAFDQLHKWTDASGRTHYSEMPLVTSSSQPLAATQTDERNPTGFGDLHGSWVVLKATMNGKASRDRSLLEGNWKFQGSELILQSPQEGTVRFSLKIDAKAQPKAFHLTSIEPENAGSGWMLFSRDGNTLKIAFYDNLQGRPASFEALGAGAEPELVVVVLSQKK